MNKKNKTSNVYDDGNIPKVDLPKNKKSLSLLKIKEI